MGAWPIRRRTVFGKPAEETGHADGLGLRALSPHYSWT